MGKPRLFIGCSKERLPVAKALKEMLAPCAEATVWNEADSLALGQSIFDGLINAAEHSDFAVFVFGPDDSLVIDGSNVPVVRDNVSFELGLFIGRIGKARAIWLSPTGSKAPRTMTDLQGINHLSFDEPDLSKPASISDSLSDVATTICSQIGKLGPRSDVTAEEVSQRRILCVASSQYSQARFTADMEYIHSFFSKGEVTQAHGVNAEQFENYFSPDAFWDIVHLGVFVDKENQNMLFDPDSGTDKRSSLRIEAIENMIKGCGARLVVIITCDSLGFGARLARFTNVIAGHQPIAAGAAISWAKVFYQFLASGKSVSQAFNTAQDRADPGLLLLAHKDVRFRPA